MKIIERMKMKEKREEEEKVGGVKEIKRRKEGKKYIRNGKTKEKITCIK